MSTLFFIFLSLMAMLAIVLLLSLYNVYLYSITRKQFHEIQQEKEFVLKNRQSLELLNEQVTAKTEKYRTLVKKLEAKPTKETLSGYWPSDN